MLEHLSFHNLAEAQVGAYGTNFVESGVGGVECCGQ